MKTDFDVIIVGSGPAGTSTALHLCRLRPELAGRILLLDRAVHPREKLCGGGITHYGERALAELGLQVEPQFFRVREVQLVYRDRSYRFLGNPAFRIVRRDEFDHWLVRETRQRGVQINEGEALRSLDVQPDGVRIETESGQTYTAKLLVGADGSKSLVRRLAGFPAPAQNQGQRMARLVEVLTPEDQDNQAEFREKRAIFDFSRMTDGLQGYYWDFPSYVQGQAFMNRGLFDSRARPERPHVDLKAELDAALQSRERDSNDVQLKGHPIHIFDPDENCARPRVLLVGDAAGADPLFGEGISFAIAYGGPAAESIVDALETNDYRFADYTGRLMRRSIFRHLRLRVRLASIAYRLRSVALVRFCWRLAGIIVKFTPWRNRNYRPARTNTFGDFPGQA